MTDHKAALLQEMKNYYRGFFLEGQSGNNAFSFARRKNRRLYVPPLKEGTVSDVCEGSEIVFSEAAQGEERNVRGLSHYVYWQRPGQDIGIVDNHNHAFAFWAFGVLSGAFSPGGVLVHVDQHKDTRSPEMFLEKGFWRSRTLSEVCEYTTRHLNVGNFIPPALKSGLFFRAVMVDSEAAFEQPVTADVVVADIDLDIFSPEMDYISFDKRVGFIQDLMTKSVFVTFATSPYFISQDRALEILRGMFRSFENRDIF